MAVEKKKIKAREINALRSRDTTRKQKQKQPKVRKKENARVEMYKKMRIKLEPAEQKPISCECKIE